MVNTKVAATTDNRIKERAGTIRADPLTTQRVLPGLVMQVGHVDVRIERMCVH